MNSPRLTDKVLTEDLPEVLRVIDDNLEYLKSSISSDASHPSLVATWKEKVAKLERGRKWLAGKMEAEGVRRG